MGEATITVVLTEPNVAVYSITTAAEQDNDTLIHAGLTQYAVRQFKVKVIEQTADVGG